MAGLDPTKIIPEEQVPIRVIDRMVLAAEAGLAQKLDEGCIEIAETADAKSFLAAVPTCDTGCANLKPIATRTRKATKEPP